MSQCDFCKTESTIIFTCSHCGNRFCKEHRRPEKHNCPAKQANNIYKPSIKKITPLEQDSNVDKPSINKATTLVDDSNQKLEESIEIVKAQSRAVLANLFGTLNSPEDYDEDSQEKYDKIYDYFLKAWMENNKLKIQIKNLKEEISEIKDQVYKKNVEYEKLLAEYNLLHEE